MRGFSHSQGQRRRCGPVGGATGQPRKADLRLKPLSKRQRVPLMRLVCRTQGAGTPQATASLGRSWTRFDHYVRRIIMRRSHAGTGEDRKMQRSMTRIRTSHVGRLPPPKGWEEIPGRLASAEITDPAVIAAQVTPAIAETVNRQVETGIDCIGDGEFWTARSLAHYTAHFTGVETRPVAAGEPPTTRHSTRERDEFPDFYADMDNAGTLFLVPGEKPMPPVTVRVVARGPIKSKGPEASTDSSTPSTPRSRARAPPSRRLSSRCSHPAGSIISSLMNITRPRKNSCSPWPTTLCARSIRRWSGQGSYC